MRLRFASSVSLWRSHDEYALDDMTVVSTHDEQKIQSCHRAEWLNAWYRLMHVLVLTCVELAELRHRVCAVCIVNKT